MSEVMVAVQESPTASVALTPRAAQEIRRIKNNNKIPETHALRLGVKGGGCSGLTYVLAFDEKPRVGDNEFEMEGLKIFIDPKSLAYLAGITLDFSDGLTGKGFVFNNPNATKTCGCGTSFCA